MNDKLKKFATKITIRSVVYPTILLIVFVAIWTLFIMATRFISKEINQVFSDDAAKAGLIIDREGYELVAKRLNIPLDEAQTSQGPAPEAVATSQAEPEIATTTKEVPTIETAAPTLDKQAASIGIFNATTVSGRAGAIKDILVKKGFKVDKTGNAPKQAKNTLEIKESKRAYAALVVEALAGTLEIDETITVPETNVYDAMVTIGR